MRYELLDRGLQGDLDRRSDGNFSERLQSACSSQMADDADIVSFSFCTDMMSMAVQIEKDAIEAVEEYDPNKWNRWPDVTPPEDVLMRVENTTATGIQLKRCLVYRNAHWWDRKACVTPGQCRFRPWEDDDA